MEGGRGGRRHDAILALREDSASSQCRQAISRGEGVVTVGMAERERRSTNFGEHRFELPNLPGCKSDALDQPFAARRPLAQTLEVRDGMRITKATTSRSHSIDVHSQPDQCPPPYEPCCMSRDRPRSAQQPESKKPAWLEYSNCKALFSCYFVERLADMHDTDDYRVRRLKVAVHLEDNTVSAIEPKRSNSGIDEGAFLRRQRVQRNGAQLGDYLKYTDFVVGNVVTLQGRDIVIAGCLDNFTRSFYESEGIMQPKPLDIPPDPAVQRAQAGLLNTIGISNPPHRVKATGHRRRRAQEAMSRLVQYLEYDRHVLRFFAVRDKSDKEMVTRDLYVLHYFLADDTVEVLQVNEECDGKDSFPKLLSRCRLPKEYKGLTIAPLPEDARFPPEPHVHWKDLHIGGTVNVYNLILTLYDCDGFTRDFLKRYDSRADQELEAVPLEDDRPSVRHADAELPPHNGFGDAKDAAENCMSLRPKRTELVPKERYDSSARLKLFARIVSVGGFEPSKIDASRRFVVLVFEGDGTVEIFELSRPNDGIRGKRFLERTRKPLNGMQCQDYTIGAVFEASGRDFMITGADAAHTLPAMEKRAESEFPESDIKLVKQKLATCGEKMQESLQGCDKQLVDTFELAEASGGALTPHEAVTLMRHEGKVQEENGDERFRAKVTEMLAVVQRLCQRQ